MKGTNYQKSKSEPMFGIVKNEENKFMIVFGTFMVTKKTFEKIADAEKYIASKPYELLINTCLTILYNEKENKNETEKIA